MSLKGMIKKDDLEVGDKVRVHSYTQLTNPVEYTVIGLEEDFVKIRQPEISGHFRTKYEMIVEVIK